MKDQSRLINQESKWGRHILWLLIAGLLTGFSTYFVTGHTTWQQWTSLVHVIVSFLLIFVAIPYSTIHLKRTATLRRPLTLFAGILALAALVALSLSGLHISLLGQSEVMRWIYDAHIYFSLALTALLFLHIALHWATLSASRKKSADQVFPSIRKSDLSMSGTATALLTTAVVVTTLSYSNLISPYSDEPIVAPYQLSYGPHPFAPSQTTTDNNGFIDERIIAGSEKCAACHEQIAHEWRSSIHGKAAADKSYVKNINLLVRQKGIEAARYCESCHAPVALLTGQLTKGGKHGGIEGSTAFLEGVSCMSCHGIERVNNLKGVGSYHFTPPEQYLFSGSQGFLANKLHNFLMRINPKQHVEDMARPILSSPKLCASCHVQFMDKDINQWGWVKMQDQYDSWLKSSFSGQNEHTFANNEVQRCQDCHFQATPGSDPSANWRGEIASHRTLAGNTAIPWLDQDKEQYELTRRFLQSGKVKIDIEEPRRNDATQSRRPVSPGNRDIEPPFYLYLGEVTNIETVITNQSVGHDFPAGATDIGEVWVHFRVADAQDRTIYESGNLNEKHEVDPSAQFYRSIPIDKNGNHVWKHDLFNMAGFQYKNTIPSGKSDTVKYKFKVPYWAKSPIIVSATIRHRNFNQKYARWALDDENINLPITDVAQDSIMVPIKEKPEAKDFRAE